MIGVDSKFKIQDSKWQRAKHKIKVQKSKYKARSTRAKSAIGNWQSAML
jgi:hypothetical protein